eukprot:1160006-Pelagomonas_calceolata.AAC.5
MLPAFLRETGHALQVSERARHVLRELYNPTISALDALLHCYFSTPFLPMLHNRTMSALPCSPPSHTPPGAALSIGSGAALALVCTQRGSARVQRQDDHNVAGIGLACTHEHAREWEMMDLLWMPMLKPT